jgi:HPt (histidine-containing phosphotransfer) domain-containing protein
VGEDTLSSRLPASAVASLHAAFAAEVRERLPRLASLEDVTVARRDAHTLGSSAHIVGEREISALARAVEEQLPEGPVPELVSALRDYLARTAT